MSNFFEASSVFCPAEGFSALGLRGLGFRVLGLRCLLYVLRGQSCGRNPTPWEYSIFGGGWC